NHFLSGHVSPFLTRPFFALQRCVTLTDNCAVMQHCTQIKFVSFFFPTNRAFFQWYLITCAFFILLCYKQKKTDNSEKKLYFWLNY
ncbi:unnamed protein product, partial [Staurois parvus]